MIKLLGKYNGPVRIVDPGDTVTIKYVSDDGETLNWSEKITENFVITDAGIFEFTDEFGLKKGVGGYFGEKNEI